jgi:hypothetical protein
MKRLTRDEARRIALNIAKLPGLLLGPEAAAPVTGQPITFRIGLALPLLPLGAGVSF